MTTTTILSSNIEKVKADGLEAKSAEISICVYTKDLESGVENPTFYATRYGMLYNPHDDFKPNVAGGQKIKGGLVDAYHDQLPQARKEYKRLLERFANSGETEASETGETKAVENAMIEEMKKMILEQQKHIQEQQNQLKIQAEKLAAKNEGPIRHERFNDIAELIKRKQAVYLHGPAGTGKSELSKQIAEELGLDFYPASTLTQEFKLSGFIDGNGTFHDTNFYKAVMFGGLFFLDEMDSSASDVLVGINGALANGYFDFPTGTVTAHKDFRVIAAGNTIGRGGNLDYTGRNALDISTLDRFWAVPLDYSPAIDKAVAKGDMELVEFAQALRQASKETDITILMSYRSISRIADFQDLFSLVQIMEMAVIKGMNPEDVDMLAQNMNMNTKNKYYEAFVQAA